MDHLTTVSQAEPTDDFNPVAPSPDGVRVRMYRPGGIGDCFLLSFPAGGHLLIDCGVFYNTRNGKQRIRRIAEDIERTTDRHLDVVVGTHEHWDHLRGFTAARDVFNRMKIDQVWLAWTEDPDDALAARLRRRRERAQQALDAAMELLNRERTLYHHPEYRKLRDSLREVTKFGGGLRRNGPGRERPGTHEQMEYLRKRVESPRYLRPGEGPLEMPRSKGAARVFVLGPPRDEALLARSNPNPHDSEVYGTRLTMDESSAFLMALLRAAGHRSEASKEVLEWSAPFPKGLSLTREEAREFDLSTLPNPPNLPPGANERYFFRHFHGIDHDPMEGPEWRRIDLDWLGAAGDLALRLDADTNNTSLVLAIELSKGNRVLLFPGDAQVGNWSSWKGLTWSDGDGAKITGEELLRRTVLYKVSHHGSHNATLRHHGLELMQSRELVAMLPVQEEQARKLRWRLPFGKLLARLEEKTDGRIVRSDLGAPWALGGYAGKAPRALAERVREDPSPERLWIEYHLPC
jgi:hypothetical protein